MIRHRSRRAITVQPPVRPSTLLRPPVETLPFPLNDEHARVVAGARSAWLGALAMLGLQSGDEVLATPSTGSALLSAFASRGLRCRWYGAAPASSPESLGLEALLSSRTRAVVVSYPLGFARDAQPWRDWCERHGLLLLEDVAHALHAEAASGPVGRHGHAAVFCLAAVLGTPDGAVLVTRPSRPLERVEAVNGRAPRGAVSARTTVLLPILADNANADRRRANFRALLEVLSDLVPEGWSDLPAGSSPLVFPVRTTDPAGLLDHLTTRRVHGWPLFASRAACSEAPMPSLERSVGLPVHQELAPADVERIVEAAAPDRRPRRRRSRLEWTDDLRVLRDGWEDLALRGSNPFASWRWVSVWWETYRRSSWPAVLTQRRADGTLMAILPLYEARRRPIRAARFVGHGPADELGPVCDPADHAEVGWALRRAMLDRRLPWDVVLAERMPVEDGWSSSLGGLLMRRESSPVIAFEGLDWQGFLRGRSRNLREQVGRRERKLQREHTVRYRLSADPDRLNADLDLLFALHRARWGGDSNAFAGHRERFHRQWAAEAQRAGWLRLWFLELDGQTVAAWYGLRYAKREFYYQAGRDPAFDAKSVGFVLLAHTMRAAADDGMREYRLLRGGESYKGRFTSNDRSIETRAVACSSVGAAAVTAAAALAASPGRGLLKGMAAP